MLTSWRKMVIGERGARGSGDPGYVRMVQRPNGKAVTIYYFNSEEVPARHIGATIWNPSEAG